MKTKTFAAAAVVVLVALLFAFGGWRLSFSDFAFSDGERVWTAWPEHYRSFDECEAAGKLIVATTQAEESSCRPAWLPKSLLGQ